MSGVSSEELRVLLLKKVLAIIGINCQNLCDLHHRMISRDILLDTAVIKQFDGMKDLLKTQYHSDMFTCLHNNSTTKQKFPGVCMLRQLMKANGLTLQPRVFSNGYNKETGEKIVRRNFVIIPID